MIWPFLYDIKRTITSKTVLILAAVILLISLAIIPFTSVGTSSVIGQYPVLYYHDSAGYHFLVYTFNQYGDPLSGINVNVTLTGTATYSARNVTDNSGIAKVLLNPSSGNYQASVSESTQGATYPLSGYLSDAPTGRVQSLGSTGFSQEIMSVIDKSNASKRDVQVFWSGDYGSAPSSYTLYYKYLNTSFLQFYGKPYPFNETEMTRLGSMPSSNYHQIFDPSLPSETNPQGMVWFELFNQTGQAVTWAQFSPQELRPTFRVNTFSIASFFFSTVLSIFVPLMVIVGSYSNYGKDRVTGVLESILARPVTRLGLSLSRFLSTVIAFSGAVIACVGIVDLLLLRYGGSYLPGDYALAIMGGLVVEVAAFTGLIFLLSHLVRSTGLLLGLSIIIFLILDFFWSIIIFFITILLGGTLGSAVALQTTISSYFANPAQFLTLINVYFLGSGVGVQIQPATYGVTPPALVADGVLWSVLPFALFLYLAIKRD